MLLLGYQRVAERLDVPALGLAQGAGLTDPAAVAEQLRLPGQASASTP